MGNKRPRSVPLHVVRAVLASYLVGDPNLGIDGGEFANALIRTIVKADEENRDKLRTIYPEWVDAVLAVQQPWGVDWLRNRALAVA